MDSSESTGRIRLLPVSVSQKIAAGEVIERPQAVVRELMDNAIDSGARQIDVFIEDGGNSLVTVQDNGCGMGRADLEICWQAHTTSKIHTIDDLYQIKTLGFRGEALSSIASVSILSITSYDSKEGGKLVVEGGLSQPLKPWSGSQGTRIEVRNLFYNLPARKQFLKRPATEGQLCKQTFLEKAQNHPEVTFRLYKDGAQELFLPARTRKPLLERFLDLNKDTPAQALFEVSHEEEDFSFSIIAARTEWFRHDRKGIQVFLNDRKIQEFGLVQAIEHAYEGLLPGGRFPVAALYVKVAPHLVDVNIHPAKKEVKLLNFQSIHSSIVRQLSTTLRYSQVMQAKSEHTKFAPIQHEMNIPFNPAVPRKQDAIPRGFMHLLEPSDDIESSEKSQVNEAILRVPTIVQHNQNPLPSAPLHSINESSNVAEADPGPVRYLGQIFGVFVLFVQAESLWIMDMHAAHERILFNRFSTKVQAQKLLLPRILDLENDERAQLVENQSELEDLGFCFSLDPHQILVTAIPSIPSSSYEGIIHSMRSALKTPSTLRKEFFADLACKAAIKDGEVLDAQTALNLITQARDLPDPRCPHGRPIFIAFSREQLWTSIGRTV